MFPDFTIISQYFALLVLPTLHIYLLSVAQLAERRANRNGESLILDKDKNPYLPFCSERCRTIDLGAWLDEKYVIEHDEPFFDSEQ